MSGRALFTERGMGREYVRAVAVDRRQRREYAPATYGEYLRAEQAQPGQTRDIEFSVPRTIGLWVAAFFTLAIFSFLYRRQSVLQGRRVGARRRVGRLLDGGGFLGRARPESDRRACGRAGSGLGDAGLAGAEAERNLWYLVPLVLGVMLLWRLAPRGAWIARWPLAFIVGTFAGLQLIGFLHGDFLAQIRNTILPLAVFDSGRVRFLGVVQKPARSSAACSARSTYFFFSFEHKGVVGGPRRSASGF